jgi:VWFA-related protein
MFAPMKLLRLPLPLLLLSSWMLAQSGAAASDATPVFRAKSQLVLVPVIVNDRAGKHAGGLSREAFEIQENGKPREISLFEEVLPATSPAPAARPAADAFANFLGAAGNPSHFTIIVLDMINTPFLKQTEGRKHLIDFLANGLPPGEPVTLIGLTDKGITQLHSFTTDTRVLIAALKKLQGSVSSNEVFANSDPGAPDVGSMGGMSADTADTISQFLQDAADTVNMMQQMDSTRKTLAAINQIAEAYSGDRARKTMIWATSGFPFLLNDPRSFTHLGSEMVEQYQQAWRALIAANIAVYPVELTGLDSRVIDASSHNAPFSPPRRQRGNPMGTSGALAYNRPEQVQDTLRAFADATGGRPCLNSNDFKNCFAEGVEDSRSYYLLGYYLPGDDEKPGWRSLKVRVKGADLKVRAREGFYVSPPIKDNVAARRQAVVTALSSSFEYTGIAMDVRSSEPRLEAASANASPKKVMQDFLVHIPASSLTIDAANRNRVDLEIAAVALDHSGKDVSRFSQGVQVSFNPEMLARIQKTGVALKESLELIPGKYECRFVVRDNQSGQIGTVHLPLEVK